MIKKSVIYINCFSDPWIKVAKALQDKHGYEPVYWVGYQEDGSRKMVAETFPNAIFQEDIEAWRGLFPKPVADKANETYVNVDFLREPQTLCRRRYTGLFTTLCEDSRNCV